MDLNKWGDALIAMATSLAGLALVAVLVSRNSATADVVQAVGNSYASVLKAAVSPISGSSSANS